PRLQDDGGPVRAAVRRAREDAGADPGRRARVVRAAARGGGHGRSRAARIAGVVGRRRCVGLVGGGAQRGRHAEVARTSRDRAPARSEVRGGGDGGGVRAAAVILIRSSVVTIWSWSSGSQATPV